MPSGVTHDAITFLLAAPAGAAAYAATHDLTLSIVAAAAFVFGGVMFGPDLDTKSIQYSRWGPFKFAWFPYRHAFKHRSRWSHGLIFGTLFRVIYFLGVVSILVFAAFFAVATISGSSAPKSAEFLESWGAVGEFATLELPIAAFAGMWLGAASHTITDVTITYIKTGRISKLF